MNVELLRRNLNLMCTYNIDNGNFKVKQRAICILGMHRSGTSAVTRATNLAGTYLGESADLIDPGFDNPEGFWERQDVVRLHDRLLSTFKRTYDTLLPMPEDWHRSLEVESFKDELKRLVFTKFSTCSLWAWKDPRTCLLLPLWREVLEELDVDLHCLIVLRNPLDVATSLQKRNGFTVAKSLGLWLNHNLSIFRATRGIPSALIFYDSLLEHGEAELHRCFDNLGLPWHLDEANQAELERFLRPDLRHSRSGRSLPVEEYGPAARLYNALAGLEPFCKDHWAALPEDVQHIWDEYNGYAQMFAPDLLEKFDLAKGVVQVTHELQARAERLNSLQQHLADAQEKLVAEKLKSGESEQKVVILEAAADTLSESLAEAQARIAALETELNDSRSYQSTLRQQLEARTQELNGLEKRLVDSENVAHQLKSGFDSTQQAISALQRELGLAKERATSLENQIDDIYRSLSWKITNPLRSVGQTLLHRKNKS